MIQRTFFLVIAFISGLDTMAHTAGYVPDSVSHSSLTLEGCVDAARAHYPLIKQYGLIEQSRDYSLANAARGYLPQVSLSAGAQVFADVVELSPEVEKQFGGMKNEFYSMSVQVNQMVYDGGTIAARQASARAEADVKSRQMDVTLYAVRERVEEIYFSILLLDEQINKARLLLDDLEVNFRLVTSLLQQGMAMQSDMDQVEVRQLEARRQIDGLHAQREAYIRVLGCFIGAKLSGEVNLAYPAFIEVSSVISSPNNRPELSLFSARTGVIDAQRKSLDAALMPRLSLFGMAMWHNKVLRAMRSDLLAAGVSLQWNIGALYTRRNDLRNMRVAQQSIDADRSTFLFNNRVQGEQTLGQITSLRMQIASDKKIIALRERIQQATAKKVENGTETVSELLLQVNAVDDARKTLVFHEVTLLKELYRMRTLHNL